MSDFAEQRGMTRVHLDEWQSPASYSSLLHFRSVLQESRMHLCEAIMQRWFPNLTNPYACTKTRNRIKSIKSIIRSSIIIPQSTIARRLMR